MTAYAPLVHTGPSIEGKELQEVIIAVRIDVADIYAGLHSCGNPVTLITQFALAETQVGHLKVPKQLNSMQAFLVGCRMTRV